MNYSVKPVDRKFYASDMLNHGPSAEIGCHTMTVKKENFNAVKTAMPAAKVTAFLASMAETMNL